MTYKNLKKHLVEHKFIVACEIDKTTNKIISQYLISTTSDYLPSYSKKLKIPLWNDLNTNTQSVFYIIDKLNAYETGIKYSITNLVFEAAFFKYIKIEGELYDSLVHYQILIFFNINVQEDIFYDKAVLFLYELFYQTRKWLILRL